MRRDVYQAISDPVRREILNLLTEDSMTVNAVADNFAISRPAVSKHIKILTECGLVHIRKRGRERLCQVDLRKLRKVEKWARDLRTSWAEKLGAVERLLVEKD